RRSGFLALAQRAVAGVELLFESFDRGLAFGDGRLALVEGLLERGGLLAFQARLALRVHQDLVRLFLGFEERFFLAGFGVALGVLADPKRLFLGAPDRLGRDALAVSHPYGEDRGGDYRRHDRRHDQVDQYRRHAQRPFWTRVNYSSN